MIHLYPFSHYVMIFNCTPFYTDFSLPLGAGLNSDFVNNEETTSNSFSTTWSYQTSAEPMRGGTRCHNHNTGRGGETLIGLRVRV